MNSGISFLMLSVDFDRVRARLALDAEHDRALIVVFGV